VLFALLAVSASGCVQPEDINRVQPNLMKKSDLTGEWFLLDTMTKTPYAATNGFAGYQGAVDRGVFEIEEGHLYLYRTYEFVQGVEAQGMKGDTDTPMLDEDGNPLFYTRTFPDGTTQEIQRYIYRSAPLARWVIKAHVDVRRSYNPGTGEESNVISEDSSEKYWYQRDYIRVDFGADTVYNRKKLSSFTALGDANGYVKTGVYEGEVAAEGLQFRVEDDGNYMDWVTRYRYAPPQMYLNGWGWVPRCLFYAWYTGAYYECDVEEINVRTSMRRVDPNNTYQALDYSDHMMSRFGFFRTHRQQWDENFGSTFSDATHQANRWDMWQEWILDEQGNPQYDVMITKPIVYYLSQDFPAELMPGSLDLADQWNKLFVELVRDLKGDPTFDEPMWVLCENNSADVQNRLQVDPNALVAETDPALCGDMDKIKYLGDLRYTQLNSVNEPTQYGLYGYGPSAQDPLTGQTFHANANMYTGNIRQGARTAVDMIEYEAGVQSFRDITQAEHITTMTKGEALKGTQRSPKRYASVQDAQFAAMGTIQATTAAALTGSPLPMDETNWAKARATRLLDDESIDWVWKNADMASLAGVPVFDLEEIGDADGLLKDLVHPTHMLDTEAMVRERIADQERKGLAAIDMAASFDDTTRGLALEYKAVYDKAVCEGVQTKMLDGEDLIFDLSAFDEPGAPCSFTDETTGEITTDASACDEDQICTFLDQGEVQRKYCLTPCNTADVLDQLRSEIRRVNQISNQAYWDPNALYADVKDDRVRASQLALRGLIEPVRESVFDDVFDRIWSTVALHEVGHTMGLRHNFASSTDALNYHAEYWDLKGTEDSEGNWYPTNLWERESRNQVSQRMRENQQTTVMEYGSGFNSRYKGLGTWDYGAIYFAYGGLLSVFNNPPDMTQFAVDLEEPEDTDPTNFGLTVRIEQPLAKVLRKRHHTNFPELFGGVDNMYDRSAVPWQDLTYMAETETDADGLTTQACSEVTDSCAMVACDMFDDRYSSDMCPEAGSFCRPFPSGFYCTKPDMVEVPIRFCSDEYNSRSPTCQTRDEGADSFETVINSIDDYEAYWPFRAYKRDNALFYPARSYYYRVMGDMLHWRKHWEHWAFDYARYNKVESNGLGWWENRYGEPWHLDIDGGLSATVAAQAIFEQMANIFGRPSTGYYGWNSQKDRYEPVVNNGKNSYCNFHDVYEDTGARPMYPSYDFSGYIYTPYRAGTFYDRLGALQIMTYPYLIYATGVDRSYDMKRFRLSFADVWPQRMQNILSGLVTGDPAPFGWCIEHVFSENNTDKEIDCGKADPTIVKPRLWFGTEEEMDAWYENCEPLTIEPEYTFPTTQYRLPALATIYGMINLSRTFDRSFTDRIRLWLEGEGTDITIPEGFETIRFTDPFSGKTYVASFDPEEYDPYTKAKPRDTLPKDSIESHGHKYWPAAWMLARANELLADYGGNMTQLSDEYSYSDLQQMVGRMEIIRGLYRRIEFGW